MQVILSGILCDWDCHRCDWSLCDGPCFSGAQNYTETEAGAGCTGDSEAERRNIEKVVCTGDFHLNGVSFLFPLDTVGRHIAYPAKAGHLLDCPAPFELMFTAHWTILRICSVFAPRFSAGWADESAIVSAGHYYCSD